MSKNLKVFQQHHTLWILSGALTTLMAWLLGSPLLEIEIFALSRVKCVWAQEYHFSVSKPHQLRSEGTASFSREEHFSASDWWKVLKQITVPAPSMCVKLSKQFCIPFKCATIQCAILQHTKQHEVVDVNLAFSSLLDPSMITLQSSFELCMIWARTGENCYCTVVW